MSHRVLRNLLRPVLITGLVWGGLVALVARPAQAMPPEAAREHLQPFADYAAEQMARRAAALSEEEKYREFIVHLEPSGPAVNPADVPGGFALYEAAVYTAVLTGDFDVTLAEILAAGFWPYATLPAEIDLSLAVADAPELHTFTERLFEDVGAPEWLAWHKAELLISFYRDFFFRPAEGQARTADSLPAALPAFWVNPFTGQPMQEGSKRGETSLGDARALRFQLEGEVPDPRREGAPVMVPLINTLDRPEIEFDLPASFMQPRL